MARFSIKESIGFGWKIFKQRPWLLIGSVVLTGIVSGLLSGIAGGIVAGVTGKGIAYGVIKFLITLVINVFTSAGIISVYLKTHDAPTEATFADLWRPELFWKLLGTIVLVDVIVFVGFILLIVPGIIACLMLGYAGMLVVDKGLNPREALRESARLTKGSRWHLLLLGLTLAGLNILGALALIVGLLITGPVSMVAMVHVLRSLQVSAPVNT